MGYPTRVQLIQRKASQQWYVNFPAALAQAMDFRKGEVVEWTVQDRHSLLLERISASAADQASRKKKRQVS